MISTSSGGMSAAGFLFQTLAGVGEKIQRKQRSQPIPEQNSKRQNQCGTHGGGDGVRDGVKQGGMRKTGLNQRRGKLSEKRKNRTGNHEQSQRIRTRTSKPQPPEKHRRKKKHRTPRIRMAETEIQDHAAKQSRRAPRPGVRRIRNVKTNGANSSRRSPALSARSSARISRKESRKTYAKRIIARPVSHRPPHISPHPWSAEVSPPLRRTSDCGSWRYSRSPTSSRCRPEVPAECSP